MSILEEEPLIEASASSKHAGIILREPAAEDIELTRVVLDVLGGKAKDLNVTEVVTAADIERTMDGASTFHLTLYDRDHVLENDDAFHSTIDIHIDDMWYRLFTFHVSGSYVTLDFIDRDVAYLMEHDEPKRASRADKTRLEFCMSLVRAVKRHKIPVVCPELHDKQPVRGIDTQGGKIKVVSNNKSWRDRERGQGFGANQDVTVKGVKATQKQLRAMTTVLDEGLRQNCTEKELAIAIMVITQESVAGKLRFGAIKLPHRGPHTGPSRYIGLFHQDSTPTSVWYKDGGGRNKDRGDARAFFRALKKASNDDDSKHPMPWGNLADKVQVAGTPAAYEHYKDEAINTVGQFAGEAPPEERTVRRRYIFSTKDDKGKKENYWKVIGRLLEDVHFARFMSNGTLYMISETRLLKSRVRMKLSRQTPGIHTIDFDWNVNKKVARATVTCRADRWIAPPGSVVQLVGCGPASSGQGRWLVSTISRSMFNRDTTIELKKPRPKWKEPAPETTTVTRDLSGADGGRLSGASPIAAMYRAAQKMHDEHFPYIYGAGHARCGRPDGGPPKGYDCSGSTAAVVAAGLAGFSGRQYIKRGQPVPNSSWMTQNYLSPGEGEFMTIWANADHVWIEFKIKISGKKRKHEHFGTGDWGKGWRGPGFNPNMHVKSGFTPRHLEGF